MMHKYSAPPPSHSTSAQNSNGRSRPTKTPAVSTVRITTDWKATTLTSQAPLRPSANTPGHGQRALSDTSNPEGHRFRTTKRQLHLHENWLVMIPWLYF